MAIRARAVEMLVAPVSNDNSGDSKLEMPAMRNVKSLDVGDIDEAGERVGLSSTCHSFVYS